MSGKRWAGAMLCTAVALAGVVESGGAASAIVGGTPSNFADYPYFAVPVLPDGNPSLCEASVIDPAWAQTAAHCVGPHVGEVARRGRRDGPDHPPSTMEWGDLRRLRSGTGADADERVRTVPSVQVGAPWDPGAHAARTIATVMGTGEQWLGGPQGARDPHRTPEPWAVIRDTGIGGGDDPPSACERAPGRASVTGGLGHNGYHAAGWRPMARAE